MSFAGIWPYGNDLNATDPQTDTSGAISVSGSLVGVVYSLTVDSYLSIRSVASFTELKRVAAVTGSGAIPTTGGNVAAIVLDRNGVTIDAGMSTINFSSQFAVTSSPVGQGNISVDNLALPTSKFTLQDATDATKQATFDASGIATGQSRSFKLPDVGGDTLALVGAAQTLVNKTLGVPVIADFSNANHTHANVAGGGVVTRNPVVATRKLYDGTTTPITISNTSMALVSQLSGTITFLNGVVYDIILIGSVMASATTGNQVKIALVLDTTTSNSIGTGTVGGERTLTQQYIGGGYTGTGVAVNWGLAALTTAGTATLGSGSCSIFAVPRT